MTIHLNIKVTFEAGTYKTDNLAGKQGTSLICPKSAALHLAEQVFANSYSVTPVSDRHLTKGITWWAIACPGKQAIQIGPLDV